MGYEAVPECNRAPEVMELINFLARGGFDQVIEAGPSPYLHVLLNVGPEDLIDECLRCRAHLAEYPTRLIVEGNYSPEDDAAMIAVFQIVAAHEGL